MHRVIWPYIGQDIGLNFGTDPHSPFVPVILAAADERLFTVEYRSARFHFAMQWVVTTAEGSFRLDDDRVVRLLIEVHRPEALAHAANLAIEASARAN